jgi:hypothetical protein
MHCRELPRVHGGACRPGRQTHPRSTTNICYSGCYRSPISDIIESLNEQGDALRLHFEAVVAAVELPVQRGKLKLRIKTFLGNPLCRGVDELCTKQLESRQLLFEEMKYMKDALMESHSEKMELLTENFSLKKENNRLEKENLRLDCRLLDCHSKERSRVVAICDQRNSALMHYCTTTNSNRDPPKLRPWQ